MISFRSLGEKTHSVRCNITSVLYRYVHPEQAASHLYWRQLLEHPGLLHMTGSGIKYNLFSNRSQRFIMIGCEQLSLGAGWAARKACRRQSHLWQPLFPEEKIECNPYWSSESVDHNRLQFRCKIHPQMPLSQPLVTIYLDKPLLSHKSWFSCCEYLHLYMFLPYSPSNHL